LPGYSWSTGYKSRNFETEELTGITAMEAVYECDANIYCLIDFLHLAEAVDLESARTALRPLVGAEFSLHHDQFVECIISSWRDKEVIVAVPKDEPSEEFAGGAPFDENNARTYVTITVKRNEGQSVGEDFFQEDFVASIATTLANTFHTEVLHSKTWQIDHTRTTLLNRRYQAKGSIDAQESPKTYSSGWKRNILVTSIESLRPRHDGPLDFVHVIHPRAAIDRRRPFPLQRGIPSDRLESLHPACTVLGSIEVPIGGRLLRGELISIFEAPEEMFQGLTNARASLVDALDYAEHRQAKFVSLGALIPSITKQGRLLKRVRPHMAITTGHGFTAITIAQMVEDIENAIGNDGLVAVMGAAGSTGRAALKCMFKRRPSRRILAVDLPQQMSKILDIPGWNPAVHRLTTVKAEIKEAAIVVCVTNAVGAIFGPDDFGKDAVILDDAQPQNVDQSVLSMRPDLRVVKCLTRIPGLHCPFEMGLFTAANLDEEVNFTCLAEIILATAEQRPEWCVIGDPTDEQLEDLQVAAKRHGIKPAEYFSFPSIGAINLRGDQ
jgi:predicted amino acid dehydrogenase